MQQHLLAALEHQRGDKLVLHTHLLDHLNAVEALLFTPLARVTQRRRLRCSQLQPHNQATQCLVEGGRIWRLLSAVRAEIGRARAWVGVQEGE